MLEMNYLQILNRICEIVQQNMASKTKESDEIEWDVHFEILLFYAMLGLKPVGVNRYFMMTAIHQRFSTYINRQLSSKVIWDHLESLYDMAALHECEIIPFPNEENDFELPEDFNELVKEKFGVSLPRPADENEAPKNNPSLKAVKKLGPSKLKQSTTPTANTKNTFLTPVPVKSAKNYVTSRSYSESKPPNSENVKGKQEVQFPAKINKVKRSSSPFTAKITKSENAQDTPDANDNSIVKKTSKIENQNTIREKKIPKGEQVSVHNASKKSSKQEPNLNTGRQGKIETPDNSSKKLKNEKEHSNKKGKVTTPSENSVSKKSLKVDAKKNEMDSNKKLSDTPINKTKSEKIANKNLKYDEVDSPPSSGSRKSSLGKIDTSEKKKKRQKLEDSSKKLTPSAKRRRT